MNRKIKSVIGKFLLLCAVALAAGTGASAAVEVSERNGMIRVSESKWWLGEKYTALVGPVVYMDDVTVNLRLMVVTDYTSKLASKGEPTVIFGMADGSTMKFVVASQPADLTYWDLSLNVCLPSTFKGNFMATPVNEMVAINMNMLAEVDVKEIRINNLVVPVKQPTAGGFKAMFDAGLKRLADRSFFAGYNPSPIKKQLAAENSGAAKAAEGEAAELPAKGDLSPVTFAAHPFGFVAGDVTDRAAIVERLKKAGWPVSDGKLLMVNNDGRFKNQFKIYGRPVSVMSAYFHDGENLTNYKLTVSDGQKSWSKEQAEEFAARVVADLEGAGFKFSPGYIHGGRYYSMTGLSGRRRVEVVAMLSGNTNTVTIEVM